MDPLGIGQANCFRTHNELTMGLLGKCPLAPSVVDPRPRDRAFDALTRAMRYLAAITDCVWALLDKETTRVSLCTLSWLTSELTTLDRGIASSPVFSNRGSEFRT